MVSHPNHLNLKWGQLIDISNCAHHSDKIHKNYHLKCLTKPNKSCEKVQNTPSYWQSTLYYGPSNDTIYD